MHGLSPLFPGSTSPAVSSRLDNDIAPTVVGRPLRANVWAVVEPRGDHRRWLADHQASPIFRRRWIAQYRRERLSRSRRTSEFLSGDIHRILPAPVALAPPGRAEASQTARGVAEPAASHWAAEIRRTYAATNRVRS